MEIKIADPSLRRALEQVCGLAAQAGGRALLVGGSVRDSVLGLPAKDLDIEVHGIEPARLKELLASRFGLDLVGQAFGVLKLRGLSVDVSVPRRESKAGTGHKGFDVCPEPWLDIKEAASRRDFTVNAMAVDPLTQELLDPHHGMRDLEAKVLRHVSDKFAEDPLRVLRGMQFAARFDLRPAPETVALCAEIAPEGLARERVMEEWRKLLLKGVRPSRGLAFLKDCAWVRHYPELAALIGCGQEPEWHPEGDVWTHTLHALDAFAASRVGEDWEDLVVGFAVLCHDMGKPAATRLEEGRLCSYAHEEAGLAPARAFLERFSDQEDLVAAVLPLVRCHMRPSELFKAQAGDSAVRRLARDAGRIDRLVRVAAADRAGRPPKKSDDFPAGRWLLERARALEVTASKPKALVMGRHLVELGLEPGPDFKRILEACYEAQLDGRFASLDQGLAFAQGLLKG